MAASSSSSSDGFKPYPDFPYFLNDLWFYNLTDGYWTSFSVAPFPRSDATLVATGHILILFGGYNGTHHFDDTWYFNTTSK